MVFLNVMFQLKTESTIIIVEINIQIWNFNVCVQVLAYK